MLNYSNTFLVRTRAVLQKIGVLRPIVRAYRYLFRTAYEDKFDNQMLLCIESGDTVWDVGANIGFFTKKFSDSVGVNGLVVAFEPAPNTHHTLLENCRERNNIIFQNIALGKETGKIYFRQSSLPNDPTNVITHASDPGAILVTTYTADEIIENTVPVPNSIKIDVEGYELDVLQGMQILLANQKLKKVFIEVHFFEMNKRGMINGPMNIVDILKANNFNIKWIDPSHIIALRN